MINIDLRILTSILERHKLSDDQSEELQKAIYAIDDGRLKPAISAEWIFDKRTAVYSCSKCAYTFEPEGYQAFFHYCPNCGAKMNGGYKNG